MASTILDMGVRDLARAIRHRELSPVEVVQAHIARVEEVNPALNAMVVERFDAARDEARVAEQRMFSARAEELPELLGVPFSVKEFVGVQGLPQTAGLYRQRHRLAAKDATAVRRLREAGAIVLGLGNVPDGGIWMETYNPIYGWTNNPWNTARTPGGSSGGEAALVAAGAVPFGVAADIGGSIRIPSACCGTVGHKPTGGLIPNTGAHAPSGAVTGRYHTLGPIARRVDDLMPLLRAMAGPDGECPSTRPIALGDPERVPIDELVVHVVDDNGRARISDAVRTGLWAAARALEAQGAHVEVLRSEHMNSALEIWAAMLAEGNDESYAQVLGCGEPFSYPRELVKLLLRRGELSSPALLIALLSDLIDRLPGTADHWVQTGRRGQLELEATLGANGVILCPSFPIAAPLHRGLLFRPFAATWVCLFNVLEFPATVVPSGFDRRGLPVGVQLVGRRGDDHRTIAAARVVEAALGGWRRVDPKPGRRRDELARALLG